MSNDAPKILGNLKRGLLFIVSAPSGTGKTSLVRMLVEEFPQIKRSISCTTRKKRPGEVADVDYHFLSEEEFSAYVRANAFLEHASVFEASYGTTRESVEQQLQAGYHVVLVIDMQGALQVKSRISTVMIFIHPPSLEVLQERLEKRGTEGAQQIVRRLEWAKREMAAAIHYDYQLVNSDLTIAYEILRSIFIAEEHRTVYNPTKE